MKEYHKIQSIFKRDEKTHKFVEGEYSLPEFGYLKDNLWVFTEKIDGTNIRVMWDGNDIIFGGKTDNAQISTFLLTKLQEKFCPLPFRQKLKEICPDGACFYGEGYGAKIQKGGGNYIPNGVDFILFDIKIGEWWLKREAIVDIAERLKIKVVPIIGKGTLNFAIHLIKKEKLTSQWGNFLAEGLVLKPEIELKTRSGHRIITKLKHKDFLKL